MRNRTRATHCGDHMRVVRLPVEDSAHRILSCRNPRGWTMPSGFLHASRLRQRQAHLGDIDVIGLCLGNSQRLSFGLATVRRTPKEKRGKLDEATRCSVIIFHSLPESIFQQFPKTLTLPHLLESAVVNFETSFWRLRVVATTILKKSHRACKFISFQFCQQQILCLLWCAKLGFEVLVENYLAIVGHCFLSLCLFRVIDIKHVDGKRWFIISE